MSAVLRWAGRGLGAALLLLSVLPPLLLAREVSGPAFSRALDGGLFDLLGRSLVTTGVSLALLLLSGTPLAWWIARHPGRLARLAETCARVPLAAPPAVLGIALAAALGPVPVVVALVLSQLCVAAPYFVLPTAAAFRDLDPELLWTARSLGASPTAVFARVAVPLAAPAALEGLAISAARALGELGATRLWVGAAPLTATLRLLDDGDPSAQRAAALTLLIAGGLLYFAIRSRFAHRLLGRRS